MPSNSRGFRSQLDDVQCVFERFKQKLSNFTTRAYTINTKSNLATPKRQLFGLFWHFPTQLIQRNGKTPLEGSKVEMLKKWDTLLFLGWRLLAKKKKNHLKKKSASQTYLRDPDFAVSGRMWRPKVPRNTTGNTKRLVRSWRTLGQLKL